MSTRCAQFVVPGASDGDLDQQCTLAAAGWAFEIHELVGFLLCALVRVGYSVHDPVDRLLLLLAPSAVGILRPINGIPTLAQTFILMRVRALSHAPIQEKVGLLLEVVCRKSGVAVPAILGSRATNQTRQRHLGILARLLRPAVAIPQVARCRRP